MSAPTDREAPELSVILTTDTYETIQGVLRRFQDQTAQARIEIVMVVPHGQAGNFGESDAQGFAAFRTIEVANISPLAKARAAGIHASTAPLVFLAETHAYPHRGWAEAMLAANHAGKWGAIAPAFGNANPRSAISCAAFLADYGSWSEGLPAGEIYTAPLFNSAYQRSALLELGDRLDTALAHGDQLPLALRDGGYKTYFAADARIDHLNVAQPKAWVHEVFLTGVMVGGYRRQAWSRVRRLAYVLGSPLIPFVLTTRIFKGMRGLPSKRSAPAGTLPLIVIGTVIRAAGEMIGYAKGLAPQTEVHAEEYELHKMSYAADRGV
jgi:hypothetical protein